MQTTLTALAVVAVGYILAYVLFDRLRDRYGYVGGAEYVLLGVLLGPKVSGLLGAGQVQDLTPIVSLAAGWLGMLLGSYFRLPTLALLPPGHIKTAFSEALTTFGVALAALFALFRYLAGYAWADAMVQAVSLAAIATLSSAAAVDAFVRRAKVKTPILPVLQLTARIDALVAVVAFGLVLTVFHQGEVAPGVRPPTATEWAVINLAVGVASGVLFHLFLGPRGTAEEPESASRLFVALAGAIVVASGASYYLNLSPIYTTLILGFILSNSGSSHRDVTRLLLATERPIYLALLIFAGAAWSPGSVDLLFIAPVFVVIRLGARYIGGRVAGLHVAPPELRTRGLARGLLAQGGIGVAIAVNYAQVRPDLNPRLVLTATLLSVLLFEVVASREAAAFVASLERNAPPPTPPPGRPAEPEPAERAS
jgi:MFS family permease